ncbi:MAG: DNA alkylation repair protein [Balneolaceae bacterium]|nr:DNA alkylation repair protein [Balneolaceae bacterium]
MNEMTAEKFITELKSYQSDNEKQKIRRYFKDNDAENRVIGVRMKHTFDLAKKYIDIPIKEIETMLDNPFYEARMGAVSIMDFQVRQKRVSEEYRGARFELYLNRHDRINNWDFVDRAAPRVIGSYLYDYKMPRDLLYNLTASHNPWERRTAIVSTAWFIKKGELDDIFKVAEMLLDDEHEYVQKAIGTWLRHAGKQDKKRLLVFLEKHASSMERRTLTTTMEKLDKKQKMYFRNK